MRMVDILKKSKTLREAWVEGVVEASKEVCQKIKDNMISKGDVIAVAKTAGIIAAKKTSSLIPLCHNIRLSSVNIDIEVKNTFIKIKARVKSAEKTGVEMEALTAASITALTIYDMCKSIDKGMVIKSIKLMKKTGGKSGKYERKTKK
jgi:cyclic pyranopterin phosphate synthase